MLFVAYDARKLEHASNGIERLRATLAFDLMHDYLLAGGHVHLRHDQGTYLCGYQVLADEIVDSTPWPGEGPWCPECHARVPRAVRWVIPRPSEKAADVRELCERFHVELCLVDDLPEDAEATAAPCGAILAKTDPPRICVRHHDGLLLPVHKYGVLHELTHLLTAPHGWRSEAACGFYAVQYALAATLPRAAGRYLRLATLDVQGTRCPVFGGILQARAWALGFLDEGRCIPSDRWGRSVRAPSRCV